MWCICKVEDTVVVNTGYRSAESHKGNGVDGVLEEDEAAQMASDVTNDSGTKTNHGNRNHEAGISVGNA